MCRIKCKNNKVTPFVSSRSRSPGGSKKGIGKFGCPLTALPLEPSPLEPGQQTPTLLNTLILCLRPHISAEGIFRACAPKNTINILKAKAESNRLFEEPLRDPLAMACLLKTWLREIPQGIVPMQSQEEMLASSGSIEDLESIISRMPPVNRSTLLFLFKFLSDVAKNSENHMTASSLAICIGPSLFRIGSSDVDALKTTNKTNEIANKCIRHFPKLFTPAGSKNGENEELVRMNSISSPRHVKKSRIDSLTPPTTPSPSSSPKSKKYSAATTSSIEMIVKSRLDEILSGDADETIDSFSKQEENHPRLPTLTRSAPLRGSKRRPSRKHRENRAVDGSGELHSSDKSSSREEILEGGSSAYERLKEGDNLEGWRSSPAISRSSTADMLDNDNGKHKAASDNNNTTPLLEDTLSNPNVEDSSEPIGVSFSISSPKAKDVPFADEESPKIESRALESNDTEDKAQIPKLDLSVISPNSDESKSGSIGPVVSPKSIIQEETKIKQVESLPNPDHVSPKLNNKTQPNTAVSSLNNTPATSPEPKVQGQKSPEVPAVIREKEETPVITRKASKKRTKRISSDSRRRKNESAEKASQHTRSQSDQHKSSKNKSRGRTPVRRDANNTNARPGTAPMTSPSSLTSPVPQEETGLERIDKLKNAVIDLEKRMFQRRAYSVRAEEITIMSELQVREEKSELQRELLLLESQFGRPSTSSERQACRAIYSRYRELKRKVHQFESRSLVDKESFLREVESEISKIELERRDLARTIRNWESRHRSEHSRSPNSEEKHNNADYTRYRHLKSRRYFLQELQQQMSPQSFTV
ncbi:unnamed protein product [Oikopleura dioica]|uniref:Rho-GAP domain-containing protein n=1 Tax=Oikopleura dioica TaxID=34765 RepID=E4WRR8_OIKDI|nr:unnamed protein product [Oikopleura dioica]